MGRADVSGKGYVLFVVGTLTVTISGIFVLLRLVGRYLRDGIRADDWTILAALVLTIAFTAVLDLGIGHGLGTHDHDIDKEDRVLAFKMLLSAQVLFKLIMGLAKVSILALYLRVFAASKYFRWACISLIIVTSVTSVAFIFPTLFQCLPLQAFWDRSIPHQCMNDLGVWLSHALINLVIDILILALPVYHVSRLGLQLRDKLALIFVFVLGGL